MPFGACLQLLAINAPDPGLDKDGVIILATLKRLQPSDAVLGFLHAEYQGHRFSAFLMVTRRCTDGARRLLAGRAVGLLLLGHVGPGSRLKPRPFGEAMADHLGRGRVGSLLDILTQESNAGRSRGVPEPKGRSSAYKHPLLFNVDEEATRKRNGGYGDQS